MSKHLAENLEKEKVFFCGNDDRLRHLILLFAPCSSVRDFVKMANVRCQACQAKYRLLAAKRVNLLGLEARPQKPASRFPYRPCSYSSPLFFFSFFFFFCQRPFVSCGERKCLNCPKTYFPFPSVHLSGSARWAAPRGSIERAVVSLFYCVISLLTFPSSS